MAAEGFVVNRITDNRLTETQIATYQREARKALLGNGYNLFAEIALRLIDHYYAFLAETENLRLMRADQDREAEFLSRDNETLRTRVADLERERAALSIQVEQQQAEIDRLKRKSMKMPPSWES